MKRGMALGIGLCGVVAAALFAANLRPSASAWPQLTPHSGSPTGLEVRFMGTSTLSLSDGQDTLLIDGYFSRPGLWELATKPLQPKQARIDQALDRAHLSRASALLVAHTHFDHALDAIPVAAQLKARLMGGQALSQITQAHPDRPAVEVFSEGIPVQVGAFTITPYLTPHAPGDVAKGAQAASFTHPARAGDWPLGEAYSWLIERGTCRILIVPSAGQIGPAFSGVQADLVFLGIGQLAHRGPSGLETYWRETVGATAASVVVPIHWDDFTRPLDQPLRPLPYVIDRFDKTMEGLTALAQRDQVTLGLAPVFSAIDLRPYSPACA